MIGKILIGIAIMFAALAVFISTRPDDFRVSRSASMAASAQEVFTQVNNLHNWNAWSPWVKMDPEMKQAYEGPAEGAGARNVWAGGKSGEGSMEITESRPNELVRIKLDFVKPFKAANDVEFTFKPEGDKTVVTWTMSGKNNFVAKAIGLFMNCEKMCGDQFNEGLSNMKTVVEA